MRPTWRRSRCGQCGRKATRYDRRPVRRWRHLPWGRTPVELLYEPWRVSCRRCGIRVEQVSWASRASRFSEAFEEFAAYLSQITDRTQVHRLLGISWETVGAIVERVVARRLDPSRLSGLRRIGIDEFSYRKRHRYLTWSSTTTGAVWCRPAKADSRASMAKPSVPSLVLAALLGFAAVAIAQQGAIEEATRHARETFDQSDDKAEKSCAALQLVLHGAEDPRYLEFLLDNARKALEGDPPGVLEVDEEGRQIRGELSKEFIAWATARDLDPEVAAGERLYSAATDVMAVAAVATTDRPATLDLLLRAVEARDPVVVIAAAEGLARMQVEPARKRLVERALSGGHDLAKSLALALLWYDDPETLAVAEKVLGDPALVASVRQQRALERQAAAGDPD